jgi:hypothetical protein
VTRRAREGGASRNDGLSDVGQSMISGKT